MVESRDFRKIETVKDVPEYEKLLLSRLSTAQINATGQTLLTMQGNPDAQKFGERFEKEPHKLFQEKLKAGDITLKCEILRKKIRSLTQPVSLL